MIDIGTHNTLPVLSVEPRGALLGSQADHALLPSSEMPQDLAPGHTLRVFVYTTPRGRMATLLEPRAIVGGFALMKVIDVGEHGAFVDWGLPKDLLVPYGNQYEPMKLGRRYVVGVKIHPRTDRLVGTTVLSGMFDDDVSGISPGDEVSLLVYGRTDRGTQVIVDRRHAGLVYHDQTFQRLRHGQELTGWVALVREDHRLDITLQRPGRVGMDEACNTILAALDAAGGQLPLHDKSSPDQIARTLHMSKKAFKKAVGRLYRNRLIELEAQGIRRRPAPGTPQH